MPDNDKREEVSTMQDNTLDRAVDYYIQSVGESLKVSHIEFSHDKKMNVIGCLQKVYDLLVTSRIGFNDLDKSSFKSTLLQVVNYNLNPYAIPAEIYFKLMKVYPKYYSKEDKKMKVDYNHVSLQVQVGVQGNGYQKFVSKMGENVKRIFTPWIVREGDDFIYPHFKGASSSAPEWTPKGNGKVIRVLYVIQNDDDTFTYVWADRESVKANLLSAIKNNIINDRGDDDDSGKPSDWKDKKEANRKAWETIQAKTANMTFDQILSDNDVCTLGKVSPAWRGPSSEQMIITKMKRNALKNISIDWSKGTEEDKELITSDEDEDEVQAPALVIDATKNVNTEADKQAVKAIDQGTASVKQPIPEEFAKAAEKKTAEAVKVSQAPKNVAVEPDTDDRPEYEDLPANNYANDDKQSSGASGSGDSSDDLPF